MSSSPKSRGTTTTLGLTPFRSALAFEIFANLSALPLTLYSPTTALNIIGSPSPNNPTAKLLTQFFGGMISALTVPLILSWPNPETGYAGDTQSGFRRATYLTLGAGEFFLGAVMAVQYFNRSTGGERGVCDKFLLGGMANMAALLAMRAVFLVWKPDLLEGRDEASKKTR